MIILILFSLRMISISTFFIQVKEEEWTWIWNNITKWKGRTLDLWAWTVVECMFLTWSRWWVVKTQDTLKFERTSYTNRKTIRWVNQTEDSVRWETNLFCTVAVIWRMHFELKTSQVRCIYLNEEKMFFSRAWWALDNIKRIFFSWMLNSAYNKFDYFWLSFKYSINFDLYLYWMRPTGNEEKYASFWLKVIQMKNEHDLMRSWTENGQKNFDYFQVGPPFSFFIFLINNSSF